MKALIVALALALLAFPSLALAGTTEFSSSSPSADTVLVSFTVERNRVYTLEVYDETGTEVCFSNIYATPNHLEPGSTFALSCFMDSVAAYSATFTIDHVSRLTPTFTWSTR